MAKKPKHDERWYRKGLGRSIHKKDIHAFADWLEAAKKDGYTMTIKVDFYHPSVGSPEKRKCKAQLILEEIQRHEGGMRYMDIVRFIHELNYPNERFDPERDRGYYSTSLNGNSGSYFGGDNPGLLKKYCTKIGGRYGNYVVTKKIRGPFYR